MRKVKIEPRKCELNISKLLCRERKYRGKYKEKTECRVVTERDTANENQFVLFEIESERRSNWFEGPIPGETATPKIQRWRVWQLRAQSLELIYGQKIFSLSR